MKSAWWFDMSKINSEGFLELSGISGAGAKEHLNAGEFPVLQGLTPLSLRLLHQSSRRFTAAKGVEIMQAGDTPHDLYFILKGSVVVGKKHGDQIKSVAALQSGNFFGEYGLLRGKTRSASVFTNDVCDIVRVDNKAVHQVLTADKAFSERLNVTMKERMLNSFLFTSAIFKMGSQSSRDWLAKKMVITEANRDDEVIIEGQKASYHYLILSGEVEVLVDGKEQQKLLEVRRSDQVLGETRLDGASYSYSARAASHLDLLVLDKNVMQMIQQVDSNAIAALKQAITGQVKKTTAAIQRLNAG